MHRALTRVSDAGRPYYDVNKQAGMSGLFALQRARGERVVPGPPRDSHIVIALFTDFGHGGPYVGQMHAAIRTILPNAAIVDLFHDVPAFNVRAGAYLLPAYAAAFPLRTIFCCVVDPGVGGDRAPVILEADGQLYVGPDNGLFTLLARRAATVRAHEILWRPSALSPSFHGRDLFAPVAAMLARGEWPDTRAATLTLLESPAWPDDWAAVLYVDHYGNAVTGLRAAAMPKDGIIAIRGEGVRSARVFGEVARGEPFYFENANGLVEIAVREGSAAERFGLRPGDAVVIGDDAGRAAG